MRAKRAVKIHIIIIKQPSNSKKDTITHSSKPLGKISSIRIILITVIMGKVMARTQVLAHMLDKQ